MFSSIRAEIYHIRRRHALRTFLLILTAALVVGALVYRVAFEPPDDLTFYADFMATLLTVSVLPLSLVMVLMLSKSISVRQQLLTIHRSPVAWLLKDYVNAVVHSVLAAMILCLIGFAAGILIVGGPPKAIGVFAGQSARLAFILICVLLPLNAMSIAVFEWIDNRPVAVIVFFVLALLLPTSAEPMEGFNRTVGFLIRLAPFWLVFEILYGTATLWRAFSVILVNVAFWLGLAALHRLKMNR